MGCGNKVENSLGRSSMLSTKNKSTHQNAQKRKKTSQGVHYNCMLDVNNKPDPWFVFLFICFEAHVICPSTEAYPVQPHLRDRSLKHGCQKDQSARCQVNGISVSAHLEE